MCEARRARLRAAPFVRHLTASLNPSGVGASLPQMANQIALLPPASRPLAGTGYVARRGKPRRKGSLTTSVTLTHEERELLERLAGAADTSLTDVWRQALRLYAVHHGLTDGARTTEVSAAA